MLKKYFLLLITSLVILTSCTINSVTTYHKDNTASMLMDIEMKEFIHMSKSMEEDSTSGNKIKELEIFPKDWKNMYEFAKEDATKKGKIFSEDNDSVRIFKKMFIKSNYQGNEMSGFSVKLDHISQQELRDFYKNSNKNNLINVTNSEETLWDGKKLILDTEYFSPQKFSKGLENKINTDSSIVEKESAEQVINMMKMMKMKFNNIIKFDSRIKSIIGKHDWLKQIDDYTIDMSFSVEDLSDENIKLKNADSKIEIITE